MEILDLVSPDEFDKASAEIINKIDAQLEELGIAIVEEKEENINE